MIGALSRLGGVLVGRFTGLKRHMNDGALGIDDVLDHYLRAPRRARRYGLPIGHIDDQWTMPLGVAARGFDAGAGTVRAAGAGVALGFSVIPTPTSLGVGMTARIRPAGGQVATRR